jgi:phosphatidylinositol-3-phosphatase
VRRLTLLAATVAAALAVAGLTSGRATTSDAPGAAASAVPPAKNVFLVIGENTSASQITRSHAPYLVGTLKPKAAWLTSYHSFPKSSSLGNYIAMTSGQFTKCEANNDLPDHCHQARDNVFQQLESNKRGWFEFNESAANACDIVDDGAAWSKNIYSAHHDPAIYYTGVHGTGYDEAITPKAACRTRDLPMGTTGPDDTSAMDAALAAGRVGALNMLVPNDCENGHDVCGTNDAVRQFDDFLAREIPKIQASPAYGAGSIIVITWDEGADRPRNPANPLLLAIGAGVRPGTLTSGRYDHYSLLATIEAQLGLPRLAHARTARTLPLFR